MEVQHVKQRCTNGMGADEQAPRYEHSNTESWNWNAIFFSMCLLISYRADVASLQESTHTKRHAKKKLRRKTPYLQQQTRSTSCCYKEHLVHNLKPPLPSSPPQHRGEPQAWWLRGTHSACSPARRAQHSSEQHWSRFVGLMSFKQTLTAPAGWAAPQCVTSVGETALVVRTPLP